MEQQEVLDDYFSSATPPPSDHTKPTQDLAVNSLPQMAAPPLPTPRQTPTYAPKNICADCKQPIMNASDGFFIDELHNHYHSQCFRCVECRQIFSAELPYVPYRDMAYCDADFEKLFVKKCAACKGIIESTGVSALGQTWHPEHFCCSVCRKPIQGQFYEKEGRLYCAQDVPNVQQALPCVKCHRPITDRPISVMGVLYHESCFGCSFPSCLATAKNSVFYALDRLPYCTYHFHYAQGTLCKGCNNPIEGICTELAPDCRYHPQCWTCSSCLQPIQGNYYIWKSKAYCEKDIESVYHGIGNRPEMQSTLARNVGSRSQGAAGARPS